MQRPAWVTSGGWRRDLRVFGLIGLCLVGACEQPGRRNAAPAAPPPEITALINPEPPLTQALDHMDRVALVAPDLRQVVVEGLRRIAAVTPTLSVEVGDDQIVLRFPDQPERRFAASAQAAASWAKQAAGMLRFAAAAEGTESATVPKRLVVTFLAGAVAGLQDPGAYLEVSGVPRGEPVAGPGLIFSRLEDRHLRLCAVRPPIELAGTGITIGAELVEIEGSALDEPAYLLGPPGSSVKLTFVDAGGRHTAEFPRGYTDEGEYRRTGPNLDIVYARPPRFTSGGGQRAFTSVLQQLNSAGPTVKAIILDLRCHPGGLLHQAIAFVDGFLPEGSSISFTEGRHREATQAFKATGRSSGGGRVLATPIVVLANRGTGSGAEMIAAALSEHGRGVVVGSTTAGLARIVTLLPIQDIGSLGLPWGTLLTPKRRALQGTGLAPDLCLDTDEAVGDLASLRKPSCRRWIARDGAELTYAERLIGDPASPPLLSLSAAAR